jgi:hypothetical protein
LLLYFRFVLVVPESEIFESYDAALDEGEAGVESGGRYEEEDAFGISKIVVSKREIAR